MQTNKNLIIILVPLTLISILISGCVNHNIDTGHYGSYESACVCANITKFNKNIEITFTNITFDGVWNNKVASGRRGEQAMDWYAKQRNWIRLDEEKSPYSSGIDGIYKKFFNETNEAYTYVFIEAKETQWKSDYNRTLSTGASYGAQMSDQWIEYHLIKINNPDLLAAFYDGNYKKFVVIYKIEDYSGSTITKDFADSLSNVGVDNVVIIKKCRANT